LKISDYRHLRRKKEKVPIFLLLWRSEENKKGKNVNRFEKKKPTKKNTLSSEKIWLKKLWKYIISD
jgi:hypothetical protein